MPTGVYKRIKKRGGWKLSEETKRRIGNARRGKNLSEETKRKLSLSQKGKPRWVKYPHPKGMLGKTAWNKGNRLLEKIICQKCLTIFQAPPSAERKFCSRNCSKLFGRKHPLWKGGKKTKKQRAVFNETRREIRKLSNGGSHTLEEWENLKKKFSYMCLCCQKHEPEIKLTEDHIVPLTKSGTDNISNIQPLCFSCNSRKHTKIINFTELSHLNRN